MPTFVTYTDIDDFLFNSAYANETNSLVGGRTTLTADTVAGATSLPVGGIANFTANQTVWILDGVASEQVMLVSASGATLTTTATTLAHTSGASVSSPGTAGCLASIISNAGRMAERFCAQRAPASNDASLYAVTRTETYTLGTLRAHVAREGQLEVWPYHFPIRSVTSAGVQVDTTTGNGVDLSHLVLPDGARVLTVPSMAFTGNSTRALGPQPALRDPNLWLSLTYTAGPIALPVSGPSLAAVPWDVRQAVWWYVMHILGYRLNPAGAASIHQGDTSREFRMRGETGSKARSLLEGDAETMLMPYRATF